LKQEIVWKNISACKRFSVALLSPVPAFITYFLLQESMQSLTARFKSVQKYPRVYTCTSRYCSFINYSL